MKTLTIHILFYSFLFYPLYASAQKKQTLQFDPYTVEFNSQSFQYISILGGNAKDLTPFEVENPRRLVLDLPRKIGKFFKESNFILHNSTCSESLRIGSHPDKTRLVIDLNKECDFNIVKKPEGLKIEFIPHAINSTELEHSTANPIPTLSTVLISPTPTITPTLSIPDAPIATVVVVPAASNPTITPTVSAKVTNTPANTPSQTPTTTPQPITATYTATATPTITLTSSITPTHSMKDLLVGKVLEQISFSHNGDINQVKLNFSQRVSFKTVKEEPRKYRISIKDCLIARPGLALPHFPPNDVVGFTLIQAVKEGPDLILYINVEDGIKINATNIDNSIVITSEPAGF